MMAVVLSSCADKTIEVALLTGHTDKHHNWELMAPHILEVLAENPALCTTYIDVTSSESAEIDFSRYDVVIFNINDVEWSDTQKRNFEEYMASGGGMVSVHEADNAFPEWPAFNGMIALGGWGERRTPAAGPFFYYSDGEYITDSLTLGFGGKHGKRVPFEINVRDAEHPIMRGLPAKWTQYDDELYGNLRGPAQNIHPLATAFADSTTGGSGKEELVLFTVSYGEGRIFHTTLGHTGKSFDASLNNRSFDVTLLRGVEWAATGDVQFDVTF